MPTLLERLKRQNFGPNDSQIVSALMNPVEAINRGGEWFRHNVSEAGGGDPYDNPNPITGPGRANQAEAGLNIAGLAQLGSMPGAPSSAGGTLGTFIGPKAASWDKDKAKLAEALLKNGAHPGQVWKDHLIGKMPDGSLFSEIDDSLAQAIPNNLWSWGNKEDYKAGNNAIGALEEFFKHDELNNNYKGLLSRDKNGSIITAKINRGGGDRGSYNSIDNHIEASGVESLDGTGKANKSILLHELQHAIQGREGWATGGSPDNTPGFDIDAVMRIKDHVKRLGINPDDIEARLSAGQPVPIAEQERYFKYLDLIEQEKEIYKNSIPNEEAYRRLTGEAQARLTQERMPLNMQQRAEQYPLEGDKVADIPFNQLINRYGGSGDQRSLPETELSIAHKIAQEHAALPVEQGGLGLPPDNTAMDRAKALGFK